MNRNDYILVMDSGYGGEYTLSKIKEVLPNENYLLFMDIKNAPYGNKTKKKLLKITVDNINNLRKKYNIKFVVFACNTLSVVVLNEVRKSFKDIFILGIFPDIESVVNKNEKTLILTTYATLKLGKFNKKYKENKNLEFVGFKDLAKRIDKNKQNLDDLMPFLSKKLKKYKKTNNVVLGCTHFNLIKNQLKNVLNSEIKFYENSNNLAINLNNILLSLSLKNRQHKQGEVKIIKSDE